jgi:hypothetical protein
MSLINTNKENKKTCLTIKVTKRNPPPKVWQHDIFDGERDGTLQDNLGGAKVWTATSTLAATFCFASCAATRPFGLLFFCFVGHRKTIAL